MINHACTVFVLWLLASGCGPGGTPPCEQDRFACDDNITEFAIDETCDLTGSLDIALGRGQHAFEELQAGEWPAVHFGSQGGQHAFVALQVKNAALDRYDLLKVNIRFNREITLEHDTCEAVGRPLTGADPHQCFSSNGGRDLLLGRAGAIRTNDAGAVEEFGILVFLDSPGEGRQSIDLLVTDPCGRTGHKNHEVDL